MRFGIGMYSAQKPPGSDRPHRALYDDMLRQARLAEAVGLDSFWIAEHHFAEDGYAAAVIPVCAAVLAATQRLIAGTAVAIASFYNPIRLAEDAIAADLLSGGRFVLGLGTGYRPEEFAGMDIAPETDEARLDEVVEILEKAFTGGLFSHHGRFYNVPELTVTPSAIDAVALELAISNAIAAATLMLPLEVEALAFFLFASDFLPPSALASPGFADLAPADALELSSGFWPSGRSFKS